MDRIVPEGQYWQEGRKMYWFVDLYGNISWRWWEGSDLDLENVREDNHFSTEKECADYYDITVEDPYGL